MTPLAEAGFTAFIFGLVLVAIIFAACFFFGKAQAAQYDIGDRLVVPFHDFDDAIYYAKMIIDRDNGGFDVGCGDDLLEDHGSAVLFALRFTKAALSGEVSDGVYQKGCEYVVDGPEPIFKAMARQLAKEIEQ